MDKALLFYDGNPILVTAEEILEGKYPRESEFVDVEYPEYKVRFITAGKPAEGEEVGIPYFRLYYSYEEYKKLHPDRADKYEIVANMRRFQESQWHMEWKEKLSLFCETERYFSNGDRWKYADAFDPLTNTCIELQHSYASFEFEDRNNFYTLLNKNMIWLFHLPKAQIREAEDGMLEILEDNARGFFRAAYETQDRFDNVSVFIQTRSDRIYRVKELHRRKGTMDGHVSTLRYFEPNGVWTEDEWIKDLREGKLVTSATNEHPQPLDDDKQSSKTLSQQDKSEPISNDAMSYKPINQLWDDNYKWLWLYNKDSGQAIYLINSKNGGVIRDQVSSCIKYKYNLGPNDKFYPMRRMDERSSIWRPLKARLKNDVFVNF